MPGFVDRLPPSASRNNAAHDTGGRHRLRLIVTVLYAISAVAYFGWRLTVLNPDALTLSILFLVAEAFGTAVCSILAFTGWRRVTLRPGPPRPGLSVDVFITVYNEPPDVIRRTALGALAMEYPHKTWILDDGNRAKVRRLAEELGCRYLSRTTNEGAKAGNLNNGLRHATGDFVAVFDADHVPQRDFLVRLLGYFHDPRVAMVQTPQDYFNMNGFQFGRDKYRKLIWHDQSVFHYVGQTGRNNWNAATFCGTSAILRRSAIDAIGGIPEDTVTEDMHASVRMQRLGYSTVYHPEPLAFGIAPTGLREYLRQRLRWGEGNMQVHRIEGLPFSSGLTWAQRLSYGALAWNYLSAWQKVVYIAAPIILLLFQIPPIVSDFSTFLMLFLPYLLVTYLMFEEIGRGFGNFVLAEKFEIARLFAGLGATAGLFRSNIRFRVSSKDTAGHVSLLLLTPQIAILALSLLAVVYAVWRQVADPAHALTPWLAVIIMCIALVNAGLALGVIADAVRAVRNGEERYRIVVSVPMRILAGQLSGCLFATTEISTREVVFEAAAGLGIRPGQRFPVGLYLPGFDLAVDVIVERVAGDIERCRVSARFHWSNMHDCDRLDLALHAGRWYRPVVGYHEASRTPYDVFRDFLDTGRLSAPAVPSWHPAVFSLTGGAGHAETLGYVAEPCGDASSPVVILFAPDGSGPAAEIEMADLWGAGEVRQVLIESELIGTVRDEAAFAVAGGRVFATAEIAEAAFAPAAGIASTVVQLPSR